MPHHGEGPHDHDHDHDEGILDKAADALGLDDDDDRVRSQTSTGMNPDADKLWHAFQTQIQEPATTATPIAEALQKIKSGVPKKSDKAWPQFTITMAQLEAPDMRNNPGKMIRNVLDAVYELQLDNRVSTLEEARAAARRLLEEA